MQPAPFHPYAASLDRLIAAAGSIPFAAPQRDRDGYLTELERDASLVLRAWSRVPGEEMAVSREVDEMPRERFDAAVEHLGREGLAILSGYGTMRGVTEAGRARVLAAREARAKIDAAIADLPPPAPMPRAPFRFAFPS